MAPPDKNNDEFDDGYLTEYCTYIVGVSGRACLMRKVVYLALMPRMTV